MASLLETFEERLQEIDAYLELLDALEREVQEGPPRIGAAAITVQQQRILYSSVYLQLYNLVEATVTWCIEAVCAAATRGGVWSPTDLSDNLQREWIRVQARTHVPLNPENRLDSAIAFFRKVTPPTPVSAWEIDTGSGGNWDDHSIEDVAERLGCALRIDQQVLRAAKQKIRDDKGALRLIKHLRNSLAHGSLSFEECGENVTVRELRDIRERTALYLREVVRTFQVFIERHEFLTPSSRPIASSPS